MSSVVFILAITSILLYASIAVGSLYYLIEYYRLQQQSCDDLKGRYDLPKAIFFTVLLSSAVLDIPLYIGCAAKGGPRDCEWNDSSSSYPVLWCMHLIATCGYVYSIITPPVLWHDILHQKDGMLWNSSFPVDGVKMFFRIAFVFYCGVIFMTIIAVLIFWSSASGTSFNSNTINALAACLEPIVLTLIISGSLWCGVRLQQYVVRVKLGTKAQLRILLHLNITTAFILVCYFARALLVLRLFTAVPSTYKSGLSCSYAVWLLGTRWMPYIFCSYCLMYGMRFKLNQRQQRLLQDDESFQESGLRPSIGAPTASDEARTGHAGSEDNIYAPRRQLKLAAFVSRDSPVVSVDSGRSRSRSHSRSRSRSRSEDFVGEEPLAFSDSRYDTMQGRHFDQHSHAKIPSGGRAFPTQTQTQTHSETQTPIPDFVRHGKQHLPVQLEQQQQQCRIPSDGASDMRSDGAAIGTECASDYFRSNSRADSNSSFAAPSSTRGSSTASRSTNLSGEPFAGEMRGPPRAATAPFLTLASKRPSSRSPRQISGSAAESDGGSVAEILSEL